MITWKLSNRIVDMDLWISGSLWISWRVIVIDDNDTSENQEVA